MYQYFLLSNSIPIIWVYHILAICQLIDILIVFDLELFWTMPPRNYWIHIFCMDTLSFLLDRHLGVDLMNINKVSLTFLETDQLFSKAPLPFYFSKSELHRHPFIFIVINTRQCLSFFFHTGWLYNISLRSPNS